MDETQRRVDEVRRESTELENHLIDEYVYRKISRRELRPEAARRRRAQFSPAEPSASP